MDGKLRLGLIGCGLISRFHLKALGELPDYEVAGIWDIKADAARQVSAEFGVRVFDSYQEMLAQPGIDVIDICLPSGLHAEYGIPAVRAGKHVIVEKPLDVTREAVRNLIESGRDNAVFVAGIFPYRFSPAAMKIKDALKHNLLGRLLAGEATTKWYRDENYYASSGWKGTKRLDGGGALINQSIHTIDLLLWFMGRVKSVASLVRTARHQIEVEDLAMAILEFENGAIGNITGATALKPGFPERIELYGEKGAIAMEGGRIVRWQVDGCREEDYLDTPPILTASADPASITADNHQRQFGAIAAAHRSRTTPPVGGEEAARAVELILDIYEANGLWLQGTVWGDRRKTGGC
jgi:predicted dehydrogenase